MFSFFISFFHMRVLNDFISGVYVSLGFDLLGQNLLAIQGKRRLTE